MDYSVEELKTIEKTLNGIEKQMEASAKLKKAYSIVVDRLPYEEALELEISIAAIYNSLKIAYEKQYSALQI